ncbi:MAG TPA: hypothetical protein VM260_14215, partial [Pirellula sp.]|nr:hypothetical protein [Pirellula sp.]
MSFISRFYTSWTRAAAPMEHSFIAWAKQRAARLPKVKLGIGDDCALITHNSLDSAETDLAITTDSLCDGT